MNRLAREQKYLAEGAALVSITSTIGGIVFLIVATSHHELAWRGGAALMTGLVSWIRARCHHARMEWMLNTRSWWLKLDEAPTLLTFPRTVWFIRRLISRKPKAYGME